MKKKVLIHLTGIILVALAISFNVDKRTPSNIKSNNIKALKDAKATMDPPCQSWGYKNWGAWASGVDGVDCGCKDREKVWNEC